MLLVGSPMCTQFPTWQYSNYSKNHNKTAIARAFAGACAHMRFVAEMYHELFESGTYLLHEHPRYATSWQLGCMTTLQQIPGLIAFFLLAEIPW